MVHSNRLKLDRAVTRRSLMRGAAGSFAGAAALYLTGCGSSDKKGDATQMPAATATGSPGGAVRSIEPRLLAQEYVAGERDRFLVGLVDADNAFVSDASVHLRFFKIGADGKTGSFAFEQDAERKILDVAGAHAHDGGGGATLPGEMVPFYVAETAFDAVGRWGVEVVATPPGRSASSTQIAFSVRAAPRPPANGAMPPASRNDTAATNPDTASLCSRDPICGLHDKVIGDVLGKGRPLVAQFSTPAYCQTRFCGPVLEVLLTQVQAYRDRIDFVHIEVYQDFQLQKYRQAVVEWKLPGEPYTFFMGADGRVRDRFEAIFTVDELKERLDGLLA